MVHADAIIADYGSKCKIKKKQMEARVEMGDIDKMAQVMLGDVCCDEDAARAYGGGCWNGFMDHV